MLATHSNLENHPRIIRARLSMPVPKIKLDSRTGLPSVANDAIKGDQTETHVKRGMQVGDTEGNAHSRCLPVVKQTTGRPRDETNEDKKARKQAVRAERQTRRADKKAIKEEFNSEMKHQARCSRTNMSRTRKL